MFKKYLLRCQVINSNNCWKDREFYFDTEEEMMYFIQNGNKMAHITQKDIRIIGAFELNKIDIRSKLGEVTTKEQAIEILKKLKESAETIDEYEDDVIEDYRNMAKYEMREMVDTLLKLKL